MAYFFKLMKLFFEFQKKLLTLVIELLMGVFVETELFFELLKYLLEGIDDGNLIMLGSMNR